MDSFFPMCEVFNIGVLYHECVIKVSLNLSFSIGVDHLLMWSDFWLPRNRGSDLNILNNLIVRPRQPALHLKLDLHAIQLRG